MKIKFMKNISTIARCAILYRGSRLENTGLSGYQLPYVMEISKKPGITQEQIASELHVNPSTVTRQLSLMEKDGFIERIRNSEDKRILEVYPTEKMEKVFPEVKSVFRNWRDSLTEELSNEEKDLLEELLEKLARRAEDLI